MKLRIVSVNDVYLLDELPRLATLVRRLSQEEPADVLLVFVAGDFLSPSLLSSLDGGRGMVACLDAVGVTHVTFGNHEDDLPTDELVARIGELRATWLATNVRALVPGLPTSDVVDVAGTKVGLLGVVMTDPAVYRRAPFGGGPLEDANVAALREAERLVRDEGCAFVVPLTHQFVAEDRALARAQPAPWFPVICGGHEHEPILEQVAGTWIVKAGADAHQAAVIDVVSSGEGFSTRVRLERLADVPDDPTLRRDVDARLERVRALERAPLALLPEGVALSSVGTRSAQTTFGTYVATKLRDALGAEACVVNGGGLRGAREHRGTITYGALEAEIPFDNELVVVALPGRVLAEAVTWSRRLAPRSSGGFLQVDGGVLVGDDHALVAVAGAPFDPDRRYRVALVRNFFVGLDGLEPLVAWAREHPQDVPPPDSGRGIRLVLVDALARDLWRALGGFDALDADADGRVTRAEVAAALERGGPLGEAGALVADLVLRARTRPGSRADALADGALARDEADDG